VRSRCHVVAWPSISGGTPAPTEALLTRREYDLYAILQT
jgi:hypothetical protein